MMNYIDVAKSFDGSAENSLTDNMTQYGQCNYDSDQGFTLIKNVENTATCMRTL